MDLSSLEFLMDCCEPHLQDFELVRLSHAANLRKQLRALLDKLAEAEADVLFARWLRQNRTALLELARTHALQKSLDFTDRGFAQAAPAESPPHRHRQHAAD